MTRIAVFGLEDIFRRIGYFTELRVPSEYGEIIIPLFTTRLRLFKEFPYCKCCMLSGKFFAIEPKPDAVRLSPRNFILNLYTREEDEFLTIDHIIPKFQGGTDEIENLQVLCLTCNMLKGARIMDIAQLRKELANHISKGELKCQT